MSEPLFEIGSEDLEPPTPEREYPITDDQVNQIRTEFERLDITGMENRQRLIESATIRPVKKLRDLSAVEARRVLHLLRARSVAPRASTGSAWDTREQDTWIDRL